MQNLLKIPIKNIYFRSSSVSSIPKLNGVSTRSALSFKSDIPDLKQLDVKDKEEYYCGPVSVADGIIMLANQGFTALFKSNSPSKLIEELASSFKTDTNGTTSKNICEGLETFVKSKGYNPEIKYQGFRPVESKYKVGAMPDLAWIKNEIDKKNAVFLNIGVYKKHIQDEKVIYERQYGHYVMATGHGHNGLENNPNVITIHDPYNRVKGDHYIKVGKINEGNLIVNKDDNESSLTDKATGFYEISSRFNYFEPDEVGIINGVISLGIEK